MSLRFVARRRIRSISGREVGRFSRMVSTGVSICIRGGRSRLRVRVAGRHGAIRGRGTTWIDAVRRQLIASGTSGRVSRNLRQKHDIKIVHVLNVYTLFPHTCLSELHTLFKVSSIHLYMLFKVTDWYLPPP